MGRTRLMERTNLTLCLRLVMLLMLLLLPQNVAANFRSSAHVQPSSDCWSTSMLVFYLVPAAEHLKFPECELNYLKL